MASGQGSKEFGEGPLSRVASFFYTLIIVEFMLVVASLPTLVPYLLLAHDILVGALVAIPLGPALSAAIYALHHRRTDLTDLTPVRQFWHGYRINWRGMLVPWLIGLAWLAAIGITLLNPAASGMPDWWAVILVLVGVLAVLWLTNALVITSLFAFRTGDALRLAWEMVPRRPAVMLGNAGVLAAAGILAVATSEFVVGVFGSLFLLALVRTSRPMIDFITAEYTAASTTSS